MKRIKTKAYEAVIGKIRTGIVYCFVVSAAVLGLLAADVPSQQNPGFVIDFENLDATGWGMGVGLEVSCQYLGHGITLGNATALDYSKGPFALPGFAHPPGSKAVELCYSAEFCFQPLVIDFTTAQKRVKLWVGFDTNGGLTLNSQQTVHLLAFNASGVEIDQDTVTFGPTREPIPIATPLEVTQPSGQAGIAYVLVGFFSASRENNGLAVDDIEFESAGPPPQAEPLTWHLKGTTRGPGFCDGGGSTYKGMPIEGRTFDLQIFLNTSLPGVFSSGQTEVFFPGPFRGQTVISNIGTLPGVDLVDNVQNFWGSGGPIHGDVTYVIFFQDGRFQAGFASPISHTPSQLVPVPETLITSTEPSSLEFHGDNGLLHVCGSVDRFSAETGPQVTEVPGDGRTPSGPGVVAGRLSESDLRGFVEVFIRGNDNRVYLNIMRHRNPGSDFTSWVEVPGDPPQLTVSEPAAVIHKDQNGHALKLFVRGPDERIYENIFRGSPSQPDNGWEGWHEVPGGGLTLSGPAPVVDQNGMLRLFILGKDNGIWENDFRGGTFTGWFEIPGEGLTFLSAPTAVMYKGVLKLFVRGPDDGIWENDFTHGCSSGWFELPGGGLTLVRPSALIHQGILKVFVTGLDDGVWQNDFDGNSFTGWSEVSNGGGLTPSAPAAVRVFRQPAIPPQPPEPFIPALPGYPTVFVRGENGKILQGFF